MKLIVKRVGTGRIESKMNSLGISKGKNLTGYSIASNSGCNILREREISFARFAEIPSLNMQFCC